MAKVIAGKSTPSNVNSNVKPYLANRAIMTCEVDEEGECYLEFCALRHIYNNHKIFVNLFPKSYKVIISGGNIIKSKQVGTMIFPLKNSILNLSNIAYIPECDSNLISLGQFWETGILYYNRPKYIVLKQGEKTIGLVTRTKNLFILHIHTSGKTMLVKIRERPTYLLIKNFQIRLWHRRLEHVSNAGVIWVSKLNDGIDISGEDYKKEQLSFDFEKDDKEENLEFLTKIPIVASISRSNSDNFEWTYVE